MKTYTELMSIAETYLNDMTKKGYDFRVLKVVDFGEGLLVVFQDRKYVENNSEDDLIIGLTPFIIDKETGAISHKNGYLSSSELIEQFKKEKGYC